MISDRPDFKEIKELEGIKKHAKAKYLGMSITCDRKTIIRDAKNQVRKEISAFSRRIFSKEEEVYRQVMISYF